MCGLCVEGERYVQHGERGREVDIAERLRIVCQRCEIDK